MKKNMLKKIIILSLLVVFCLSVFAVPVFAQFKNPVENLSGDVDVLTGTILKRILGLIGIVALILILYAGFIWMTAQGDAKKIESSRKIMLYAVIGLFIVFGSYIMTRFVFRETGEVIKLETVEEIEN